MMKNYKIILTCLTILLSTTSHAQTYDLIAHYGENTSKLVRWPDGVVKVYDKTNYEKLPDVLKLFNKNMKNTQLELVSNIDDSQIVIELVDYFETPFEDKCGLANTFMDKTQSYYIKALIRLRPSMCLNNATKQSLYIHELGHALGFARHTDIGTDDVMAEFLNNKGTYDSIGVLTKFINGLYTLPAGSIIDKNMKLPIPVGGATVKKENEPIVATVLKKTKVVELQTFKPLNSELRKIEKITPRGMEYQWIPK